MNNVPFDVAFSLDEDTRKAWVVIVGQLKGMHYDWITHRWKVPS